MHLRPCSADLRPGILRSLSVIAAAVLTLGGCSTGGVRVLADTTPSPLPCRPDAGPILRSDPAVRSAGTPPLTELRYRPNAPATLHAAVSQTIVRTVTSAGGPATARVTARVPYTVRFSAICGSHFTTETVYGQPRVLAGGADIADTDAVRSRLGRLDGLVVRESRDTRGRLVASSRSAPAGVDQTTQQSLDDLLGQLAQSAVVFPEQPLGVGARWTIERGQTVSGFALDSTARYTVRARTLGEVSLDVALDVTARPQVNSTQGHRVSLLSYRGTGSGSLRINLGTALPSSGSITLTVDQKLDTDGTRADNQVTQVVRLSGP
ncbi:MAG TPA: hypothetical protein VFX70_01010 [Mycobacteriales bacterium]|nr:hypothetical protein [Mycobacteriales bacterium]